MSAPHPRTTLLIGGRLVNVAGESHYQEALREIVGATAEREIAMDTEALLIPEPTNPHDPNAVMVQIDGKVVGYLPRDEAVAYGPALAELAARGRTGACEARIAGRGGDSGTSNLGVFLRLPDPDESG
ncbi:MAG TPA: HIRAN domain-containing protein [Thermoleophilaceae bacterium]|nr:HIRAN domain-containing protein [Thermoleophilaceae bacterium]